MLQGVINVFCSVTCQLTAVTGTVRSHVWPSRTPPEPLSSPHHVRLTLHSMDIKHMKTPGINPATPTLSLWLN